MAYASFPAQGYLSNAARTDADMQAAFEQWRTACQHTTGHGQCQLNYVSPSRIVLLPHGGNRMNLTGRGYSIPDAGFILDTPGYTAPLLYCWLIDWNSDLTSLTLHLTDSQIPYGRGRDVEYGHQIMYYNGGPDTRAALVGAVNPTLSGTFTSQGVVSLYNQRLRAFGDRLTAPLGFASASPVAIIRHTRAGFVGDTLAITATVSAVTGAETFAVAQLRFNGADSGHTAAMGIRPNAETSMTVVGWYGFQTDGVVNIDLMLHVGGAVTLGTSTALTVSGLG